MLYRASLSAHKPALVAQGLARLLGGRALVAPSPPFPEGGWLVCLDDAIGTLIEVMPWGFVLDPDRRQGRARDSLMRERSGSHMLLQTPLSKRQIEQAALDSGWEYAHADAGLYKSTKVWVEGMFLVEVMTRSQAEEYQSIFGIEGADTLEAKLNALEVAYAFASTGQRS
jgi:hypothetical protein